MEFTDLSNEAKLLLVMLGTGFGYADMEEWCEITGADINAWLATRLELGRFHDHCLKVRTVALSKLRKRK